MRYILRFPLIFIISLSPFASMAQNVTIDSLLQLANQSKSDTAKLSALLRIAKTQEDVNLDDAKTLYNNAIAQGTRLHADEKIFSAWISKATIFLKTSQWDSAFIACGKADTLASRLNKNSRLAEAYIQRGDMFQQLNDFPEALKWYQRAEPLLDRKLLAKHASRFIDLYDRIDNIKASREYGYKAIRLAAEIGDSATWVSAHIDLFSSKEDSVFAKGYTLLRKALPVAIRNHYTEHIIKIYHNLGIYYYFKSDYDSAIYNATLSASYMKKPFDTDYHLSGNFVLLGNNYLYRADAEKDAKQFAAFKRDLETAIQYARKSIFHAQRGKVTTYLRSGYRLLSQALELGGYEKESLKTYRKYIDFNDSVNRLRNAEQASRMEARFQNEKKQREIENLERIRAKQEDDIRARNILILVAVVILALVVLAGLLLWKNTRVKQKLSDQREELQRQKIVELQKDKEIMLANAVVKSQEEERSRIAKDLHDGIGGMLSGVKLTLASVKGNVVMSHEHTQVFERSLDMIDHSIKELRQVSHNLMPEALAKFGLSAALKDFADFINQSNTVKVVFQQVGTERRLDSKTELLLYRVVNELINNALKHAGASEIVIQVHFEAGALSLTVEDNGKGFDKEILNRSTGLGWANIKSRIEYLGGTVDVNTSAGQGTTVLVNVAV